MDKEKILEAARFDKNRGKEYEHKQTTRGSILSIAMAILVGIILFFLEYFAKGTLNFGLIAVAMTAGGAQYIYEGITLKKVRFIVFGILYSVVAIFFILAFIGQVVLA